MGFFSSLFGFGESEAEKISNEITNIKQYHSLERKVENSFNSKKFEILQEALDIASKKILQWQYVPNIDVYTPRDILEKAFQVYTPEEYKQLKILDNTDWYGITGTFEPEETPVELKFLIKLQSIIEDDLSQDAKIKKINLLYSRNKTSLEYFFEDITLSAGEQWFAGKLELDGLPLAFELYNEGYTTEEKCLKINYDEFLAKKGVGKKTLEKLIIFQEKIKDKLQDNNKFL